jgi:hypothetical protein
MHARYLMQCLLLFFNFSLQMFRDERPIDANCWVLLSQLEGDMVSTLPAHGTQAAPIDSRMAAKPDTSVTNPAAVLAIIAAIEVYIATQYEYQTNTQPTNQPTNQPNKQTNKPINKQTNKQTKKNTCHHIDRPRSCCRNCAPDPHFYG